MRTRVFTRGLAASACLLALPAPEALAQDPAAPAAAVAPMAALPSTAPSPPMWPYQAPVRNFGNAPKHRNEAMMWAGIVITALGVATVPTGLLMVIPSATGMSSTCPSCAGAGLAVLIPVGATVLPLIGIPLWLSGSRPPGAWSVSLAPALTPGSASATLHGSF